MRPSSPLTGGMAAALWAQARCEMQRGRGAPELSILYAHHIFTQARCEMQRGRGAPELSILCSHHLFTQARCEMQRQWALVFQRMALWRRELMTECYWECAGAAPERAPQYLQARTENGVNRTV